MRLTFTGLCIVWGLAAGAGPAIGEPAAVRADSLEAMVRFLSEDPTTGASRSRFVLREHDIGAIADSLAARLGHYTGNPVDRVPFSIHDTYYTIDSTFNAENVVARLEGTGALAGVILVTAHYDAIALRTPGFRENWQTMSAPGADDNATGVAGLMELARTLPGDYFPFDIVFVAFSGEELGALGSADFIDRFPSLYGEEILGVINFDMLGFNAPQDGGTASDPVILTDYRSGWLAEMLAESAAKSTDAVRFRIAKPGPSNYDHGPLWKKYIPTVTIAEPLTESDFIRYPFYHTIADTISADFDFGLVERLTNAAGTFLTALASSTPEISILPSDMMLMRDTMVTGIRNFDVGDSLGIFVRVRNTGCQAAPPEAVIILTVSIENAGGGRRIYRGDIPVPAPLKTSDVILHLMLGSEFVGGNLVHARVAVSGMDDSIVDNEASTSFGVRGAGATLLTHGFRPNPVDRAFRGASFCVNLAAEADIEISLFTVEGERLAVGKAGSRWGAALEVGINCLSCGVLFPGVDRLASGIYLYRLTVLDPAGRSTIAMGRFAVAR
jgi:hypothetical protein